MKISIIIPVYNVERYVERCLASVMAPECECEIECLIINDQTPDNSMGIISRLLNAYDGRIDFKIISHECNKGLSGARNTGINASSGDYLFFLDSDDELPHDSMQALSSMAHRYCGVDVVFGNICSDIPQYRYLNLAQYGFPEYSDDRKWIQKHLVGDVPVTGCNWLVNKGFLIQHGLMFKPGIMHEDEHWRFMASRHIRSVAFCLTPTYIYHLNGESLTHQKFKDRSFRSHLAIFRDYLPVITDVHQYSRVLTYVYRLTRRLGELRDPETFMADYAKFLNECLAAPYIPRSVKPAIRYMQDRKFKWRILSRMFCWRSNGIIRHFDRTDAGNDR